MTSVLRTTSPLGLSILCLALVLLTHGSNVYASQQSSDGCQLIIEALKAAGELKPGMLRSDLEKSFVPDGGLSFPGSGTYIFRKCHYIKIDVEFGAHEFDQNTRELSRTDPITKVSKPYLAYPVAD